MNPITSSTSGSLACTFWRIDAFFQHRGTSPLRSDDWLTCGQQVEASYEPLCCKRREQSQKSCTNACDSWYSQYKKEAVRDTPQVAETADVRAEDAGAATFRQDQKGQQGVWRSIVGSTPSCEETKTDRPAHRATVTANRWATQSLDDVGSGMYGYCYGAGTTAPPSRTAEGAADHCRQA